MRSNKTNNQDLPQLLTEDFADGTFAPFLQSVQGSLKNFGDTISSAAKLIGSDVAVLINLTFGRLKKNSDLRSMMSSYRGQRTRYIDQVLQNGNKAMESWPDSKITAMLAAPSLFFTTETLSGMGNMFSPTFRQEIGQYGPSLLPGIGGYFEGNRSTAMNNIFGHWSDVDYTDENSVNRAWAASLGALGGKDGDDLLNDKKGDKRNILTKMAEKITDMFLIAHHELDGSLLSEGDEKEGQDIDTKALKAMLPRIRKLIMDQWPKEEHAKFLKSMLKINKEVTEEAQKVLDINTELTIAEDSASFLKALGALQKLLKDKAKDLNVSDVESKLNEMKNKLSEDEETKTKLEKMFEEKKIEKTEENLKKEIDRIAINSVKSQFIQGIKDNMVDYYEDVYDMIAQGCTPEQIKVISKDPMGKEFADLVQSSQKSFEEVLSKFDKS